MATDELYKRLYEVEKNGCRDQTGKAELIVLDLRTENIIGAVPAPVAMKTSCSVVRGLLDALADADFRAAIPRDTDVVTITETGNRDQFANRYLYKMGYSNITSLVIGMRGWIKAGYPAEDFAAKD